MKITCLITVCVYLSSTISAVEIKYLNRVKKPRLREGLIFKDHIIAGKEINPTPKIYPHVFSSIRDFQPRTQIEPFPKFRRIRESQSTFQQQTRRYNRGRSRHPTKRLKTRSIAGESYELNDNQLKEVVKPIPKVRDEQTIHIEPVVRVTKKNVLESIVDIVRQLLNPKKNELGPLVGPIQIAGKARKVYIRLLEPVDSSHVMVRFVTQVPVPVVDAEAKHIPLISIPSVVDPVPVVFNGHHSKPSSESMFGSSSRHNPIQSFRNNSFSQTSDKGKPQVIQPPSLNTSENPSKNLQGTSNKESFSPDKAEIPSGSGNDKDIFTDTQLNLESPGHSGNRFLDETNSYYQYQSTEDAVKQVIQSLNDTITIGDDDSKSIEPWQDQLSTYRLPLRQVAPLYSLTSMENTDHSSDTDTYKVPTDVLTAPNFYSSPYEQYTDVNSAPGSYANSYDQHFDTNSIPSPYPTVYNNQNDINTTPSTYSTFYQKQNDVRVTPNSYPIFYGKQEDLYTAPSSYKVHYDKPNNDIPSPSSSHETYREKKNDIQTASSTRDALRIINPPYFVDYGQASENYGNRSYERATIRQPRYNLHDHSEAGPSTGQSGEPLSNQMTRNMMNREKSESIIPKSGNSSKINANHERWQPIIFIHKNTSLHETDLVKVSSDQYEKNRANVRNISGSPYRSRETSQNVTSRSEKEAFGRRRNIKRHSIVPLTSSESPHSKRQNAYELTTSMTRSVLYTESTTKTAEQETQPTVAIESKIIITPKSVLDDTFKSLDSTTKNSQMSSTTEKSPPTKSPKSRATQNSTTQKSVLNVMDKAPVHNITEKLLVSNKTEITILNNTMKKAELPRRPMIMKKPTFIMKRTEMSSTTRRSTITNSTTQKSQINSTTKRSTIKRKSTFQRNSKERGLKPSTT